MRHVSLILSILKRNATSFGKPLICNPLAGIGSAILFIILLHILCQTTIFKVLFFSNFDVANICLVSASTKIARAALSLRHNLLYATHLSLLQPLHKPRVREGACRSYRKSCLRRGSLKIVLRMISLFEHFRLGFSCVKFSFQN